MTATPRCENCGKHLDRIDHYAIEFTILDGNVYRPVAIDDRDATGERFGLASDTDLRCGYCGKSIPRSAREFFYRRWWVLAATQGRGVGDDEPQATR